MKLAIILPAYNEELTIERVIEDFYAQFPEAEIYVINNRSSDHTGQLARRTMQRLKCSGEVIDESRPGKAFAVARAFRDIEADYYLLADADLTYPAKEGYKVLGPVLDGVADMAVGNRHAGGSYRQENKRRFHNFGNGLVRVLINFLFSADLNDILSGYRGFSRRFVKNYPILSKGFAIEAEMTMHALDKGFTIAEVPIEYKDRPQGSVSKLRTISDGRKVLRLILEIFKHYHPLTFFGACAFIFFLFGLATGMPVLTEYIAQTYITHVPLAILATGLMVLSLISLAIGLILDTVNANHRFNYQHKLIEFPTRTVDKVLERKRAWG